MHIAQDTLTLVGEDSRYRFVCPCCDNVVSKPVTARIAALLSSGGVEIEESNVLDSVLGCDRMSGRARRQPPPLTLDDLLDLHLALQGEGWFDEFAVDTH